jgi:putative salt-induced outer membrane protein
MRAGLIIVPAIFLFSCVAARARAQALDQQPAHQTSAEVSFVGTSGNSSTESVGLGISRIDRVDGWLVTSKGAYVHNSSFGELRAESIAMSFQAGKIMNPNLNMFARYGFLHDRFAGIRSRNTVALGQAYTVVNDPKSRLIADGALGYANEERTTTQTTARATWDMGLLYDWKLSDTAEITDESRLVFALGDSDDWRSGNVATLSAKLTTVFSLKVSNTVRYVNQPVPGFESTDTITAVALVAKF